MPNTLAILRTRRERRLGKKQRRADKTQNTFVATGMVFSILLGILILSTALFYANLTRNLPSAETLAQLLSPPNGLLLQPTRIYDRTAQHLLFTFAPTESPRRYIPLTESNPQHLPPVLAQAIVAVADPTFWNHPGYNLSSLDNPNAHPTIAQKLVADLMLYTEAPSLERALRERLLAAQITAQFGRTQILEWYINSVHFGRYAFGAEAAAQLYFKKSASELTLAESAILAGVSDSPSLNPLDAPLAALQRGRDVINRMKELGVIDSQNADLALLENPAITPAPQTPPQPASAFINVALAQLDSKFTRARIERGGVNVITTLDYNLYQQAACATEIYAARLAEIPEPEGQCEAARYLPSLPPGVKLPSSSSSALIMDPATGQVLAIIGETLSAQETPLVTAHKPGSSLDAFIYLTGFTRGLSPASLMWDIPGSVDIENYDGVYHGPVRLRFAMANDYRIPAEQVLAQMGVESVSKIASSFGLKWGEPITMLDAAGAYGVFSQQGVYYGQEINGQIKPTTVLRVESIDHTLWLDWSLSYAQPVTTSALSYLVTNVLSDESAHWASLGKPNVLDIGRPAGIKFGQTDERGEAWLIGYTPSFVVLTRTASLQEGDLVQPRVPAVLWSGLMQYVSRNTPPDGWIQPAGVTTINVCDPSGLLPTKECAHIVSEVFINGNEPVQRDNIYRAFEINRETGYLATVFTPPQLVEERVYLVIPPEARAWAQSAGIAIPPENYDAIQPPLKNPQVNISAPQMFSELSEKVSIIGTASGNDFVSYRVMVGQGLNPEKWINIAEAETAIENGILAEWDTKGLSGLYAIQLQVVRADSRVDIAIIQVAVK